MSNKPNENPDKKDFLSSLVSDTKPESFAQEEVTRIEKRPFKLDKTLLAILGGAAVIVAVASWFLFFAPNVKMGDFVGKNVSEVQIWVRQNSIASTDIIISERYDFNTAKDVVIEQSLAPNTAFRKGTKKITIVVSLGPDPDEKITFPDLANMNYSEITAWRDSNKLLNVSIKQVYSSTVEEGNVISYDLRNVPEGDFTRGTSLTINISRGPQPVGQVEVVNYEGKTLMEFETWASGKGLKYSSSESYSDTVQEGLIISQSIKSGTVDAGTEITVVVSKGKAATMTNLVGKSDTQAQAWCSANGVNCQVQEVYHNTALPHTVVKQSAGSGSIVDAKTIVELQVSLGRVDFKTFTGSTISELRVWVEEMNYKQAGLNLVEH
ncbi:MAG: PASTA domain-containing protein, partial [Erysipelotrichaceae bacterium]|nr:PASTA domain-containing protein [Erysipelotrichaceae bacterium]